MKLFCLHARARLPLAAAALVLALPGPLLAASGPIATQHVRGTVASVNATSAVISTAQGPVTVAIAPKTAYIGVTPATVDDIKPNTFVGVTNVERDGQNQAVEVHIFPESMRGMAEGDYAWDLPSPGGSHSSMTNGTVGGSHSSMTNGTVGASHSSMTNGTVSGAQGGRTLHLAYKGGTKTVVVPAAATIVKFDSAQKSILVPGAHVLVIAGKSGNTLSAKAVVAGRNGLIPPM